jgi:hypothetical protein
MRLRLRRDRTRSTDASAESAARAAAIEGRAITQGELNTGFAVLREVGGRLVGPAPKARS